MMSTGKRYLLVSSFAAIAYVVGVLVWLGYLVYEDSLPPPAVTDSVSFNEKAVWLSSRLARGCNVLAIGSSMSLNNLDSATIQAAFPDQRYLNAASWGMPPDQAARLLDDIKDYCRPKVVFMVLRGAFGSANRDWLYHEDMLRDLWDGGSRLMIHLRTFSMNYYQRNAHIRELRTSRAEYASLEFDDAGGVPLDVTGFHRSTQRWNSPVVPAYFTPGTAGYEALARIARTVQSMDGRLIVVQAVIRPEVLDPQQLATLRPHWKRLSEMAKTHGFRFLNLAQSPLFNDGHFADSTHLNKLGAQLFTTELLRQAQ